MSQPQYVRLGRIKPPSSILHAARHNLREIQREFGAGTNIDSSRSHLNEVLCGPSEASAVNDAATALLQAAGITKARKNGVRAVEILVGLPVNFIGRSHAFFADALEWVRSFLGGVIFSAVVHRDESAEHMHVLVLPIIEGKMRGRDYIGDLRKLQTIQGSFHASVGQRHGLERPPPKKRLTVAQRRDTARDVVDALAADHALLRSVRVRSLLCDAIAGDPVDLAKAIGVAISPVLPEPKSARSTTGQNAIADQARENAIAVYGPEAQNMNRYPVYSGLSSQQQSSCSLH